jgi:hypothetical protein
MNMAETEGITVTVADLRERVLQIYPELAQIPFAFAVNYKAVSEPDPNSPYASAVVITPHDEIALLPPINGS